MSRYAPLLDEIKRVLEGIAPGRTVTRAYADFAARDQSEVMAAGVYVILPRTVNRYDYETSDQQVPTSSLRATANGQFGFVVVGQQYLGEAADGGAVDAAEFQMLQELEQLADDALEEGDGLHGLVLRRATFSQQAESPWAWIHTEWDVFPVTD